MMNQDNTAASLNKMLADASQSQAIAEAAQANTMSSLEIAERTGKRHADVMRDIRNMLENLKEGTERSFAFSYKDSTGRTLPCYRLPKRECLILAAGYDVGLRAKIIDRWIELEAQATPRAAINVRDQSQLATIALQLIEVNEDLKARAEDAEKRIEEVRPKVEAHDRIAEAYGSFSRTTAAKMLQIGPHELCRWLRTNCWTYRRPGDKDDLAYQSKIAAGLLEHKVTTGVREDGSEWVSTQVRITAKGLTVLAKAFPGAVKEVP